MCWLEVSVHCDFISMNQLEGGFWFDYMTTHVLRAIGRIRALCITQPNLV